MVMRKRLFRFRNMVFAVVVLAGSLAAVKGSSKMYDYIFPPGGAEHVEISWQEVGDSPEARLRYTPQGITYIDGSLVLAESWNDKKNVLYVLRADVGGYSIVKRLDMPSEAVHTSGLEWDGEYLWAVDYVSNILYKIDWGSSARTGTVKVVDSCPTGLNGTGSVARLRLGGEEMVVVSDFMNTGRTYFVPLDKAFDEGDIPGKSAASYKNAYFVQGLTAKGGYLYESANILGSDLVYKIDPLAAIKADDYSEAIIARYSGPSKMIEDLAFDGQRLWTSDEHSFKLYATDLIK